MKKRLAVLGSTGSIGRQTLDVVRMHPDQFEVVALSVGCDADGLIAQAKQFSPRYVGISKGKNVSFLKEALDSNTQIIAGEDAPSQLAMLEDIDVVVNGVSGIAGMRPLISALKTGKSVALANKESIVCGHHIVEEAKKYGGRILPVDSEQSAIFQCLAMGREQDVDKLLLTASGGPFRLYSMEALSKVTPAEALKHPTWNMGKKITIDSATLFNKGLEVMEASYLFDVSGERIEVVIHPQSIVHSMVAFRDGTVAAQMSLPDMRLAIQYALTYPERIESPAGCLDFTAHPPLEFFAPDRKKFPALSLAYSALEEGHSLPVAYNGADEAAVELFFEGKIGFLQIADCVEYAMAHIDRLPCTTEEEIFHVDAEARRLVLEHSGK